MQAEFVRGRAWGEKVLGLKAETSSIPSFSDIASLRSTDLYDAVIKVTQMGLMGQTPDGKFRPYDAVSRAEFGTILSRALWKDANGKAKYDGTTPYYAGHLNALKNAGIMTQIGDAENVKEIRGYVFIMLERTAASYKAEGTDVCKDPLVMLACTVDPESSSCPAACKSGSTEPGTPSDPNYDVKAGDMEASLKSSKGGDIPYEVSSLSVGTYKFIASNSDDINISSLTFKQTGYGSNNTVTGIALFINGQRVSKVRDVNLNRETTLSFTNTYILKKGSSIDIEVRATLGGSNAAGQQFALELTQVNSSAENVKISSAATETFKVVNTPAVAVKFDNRGAVESPKVGTTNADVYEFTVSNSDSTSSKQDVVLNTITLIGSGNNAKDLADYLKNIKLMDGDTVVARAEMNGKYLTFNFDNYKIIQGRSVTFTIKADIVGGAGETIDFTVEDPMDIVVLGNNYNTSAHIINNHSYNSAVKISAGRVTIERANPDSTVFVAGRTNLYLGSFTINNNAGGALRLTNFNLHFNSNSASGVDVLLDSVKVRFGSTSAGSVELDKVNTGVYKSDYEQNIGSKLVVYVYADITKDTSVKVKDENFYITLENVGIEETADNKKVTDISLPSRWTTMEGKEGELTLTNTYLADKSFSKGTTDIEAVAFKLEAGSEYGAKIKRLTFSLTGNNSSAGTNGTDSILRATLYKGNSTNGIAASSITTNEIRFTQTIELSAGEKANFVLKVDLAANPAISTGLTYILYGSGGIEVEDTSPDRNIIKVSDYAKGRKISVVGSGSANVSLETAQDANKRDKTLLAGTAQDIAAYNVFTTYEEINVKGLEITFSKPNLGNSVDVVQLVYNGQTIDSRPLVTSGTTTVAVFDKSFDLVKEEKPMMVKLITKQISGSGMVVTGATITKFQITKSTGKESGEEITINPDTNPSKSFDIVPVTIIVAVPNTNKDGQFTLTTDRKENTTATDAPAKAILSGFNFRVENAVGLSGFSVQDDAGGVIAEYDAAGNLSGTFTYNLSAGTNTLKVVPKLKDANTYAYSIVLNGVIYYSDVDGSSVVFTNTLSSALTVLSK